MTYYDWNEGRDRWLAGRIRKAAWRVWEDVVGPDLTFRLQMTLENDGATERDDVWECVETEALHICWGRDEIYEDITREARALFLAHDAALGALETRDGRVWEWVEPDEAHIRAIVETEFTEERVRDMVLGMAIAVAYVWNKAIENETIEKRR